jgi:regulator of protease activity HflC (stomatin/prohibitin superfamily)
VIRDTISQYRVDQVYSTKRNEVAEKIRELMAEKMQKNGCCFMIFFTEITFSPEYAASVEQKQIAEQRAQQRSLSLNKSVKKQSKLDK